MATTIDPIAAKPHQGKSLMVAYAPSILHAELLEQFAHDWAERSGATVEVALADTGDGDADIIVVSPAELSKLVESGTIQPVPAEILDRAHPFHWDSLFPIYSRIISSWGKSTYGIPLLGECRVMVYRSDRLAQSKLNIPQTWEDFVAVAKSLAKNGRPSLPPLPKRAEALDQEFHAIAACYDRAVIQQSEANIGMAQNLSPDEIFSYQYRLNTAHPRIDAPAFVYAFQLLKEMRACRIAGESDDPAGSFLSGETSLCIANLSDVARFQRAGSPVRGKFKIATIPGAAFAYDLDGNPIILKGSINQMPYIGGGGWIGVVRKKCTNPQIAFEFLTEFAHPEKMGAEIVTSAKWGAGPLRASQVEERTRGLWLGYDLPHPETETLLAAIKAYVNPSLVNPRYRLRLPNQQEHLQSFDRIIRPALHAESADGSKTLREVNAEWTKLWTGIPESRRLEWVRLNYGLVSNQ